MRLLLSANAISAYEFFSAILYNCFIFLLKIGGNVGMRQWVDLDQIVPPFKLIKQTQPCAHLWCVSLVGYKTVSNSNHFHPGTSSSHCQSVPPSHPNPIVEFSTNDNLHHGQLLPPPRERISPTPTSPRKCPISLV